MNRANCLLELLFLLIKRIAYMAEDTTVTSFGLSVEQLNIINRILTQAANVQSAYLFGSRAKGTNKPASDIDLAIKGIGIQKDDIAALWAAFEESNLPFFCRCHILRSNPKSRTERSYRSGGHPNLSTFEHMRRFFG